MLLCRMTSTLPKLQLLSKLLDLTQTRSGYARTWRKSYGTVCFSSTSASAPPVVQGRHQQHRHLQHLRNSHISNTLTSVQSWDASGQQPPLSTQCALFPGFQGACPRNIQPRRALHQGQGFGARPVKSSSGELPGVYYWFVMSALLKDGMVDVNVIVQPNSKIMPCASRCNMTVEHLQCIWLFLKLCGM